MAHGEVNNTGIWHVHKADATAWDVTLFLVLEMSPHCSHKGTEQEHAQGFMFLNLRMLQPQAMLNWSCLSTTLGSNLVATTLSTKAACCTSWHARSCTNDLHMITIIYIIIYNICTYICYIYRYTGQFKSHYSQQVCA